MELVRKERDVVHKRYHSFKKGGTTVLTDADFSIVSHRRLFSTDDGQWSLAQRYRGDKTRIGQYLLHNADLGHSFICEGHDYRETGYHLDRGPVRTAGTDYYMESDLHAFSGSVNPSSLAWPSIPPIADLAMIMGGTEAIAKVLPKNSASSCYVAVGEIMRDGIPHPPLLRQLKARSAHFKDLGDEYLNVQFGWKPFVNDIRGISRAAMNSHSVLSQYERDSGRQVRRRYYYPISTTTSTTTSTGQVQPPISPAGLFPALAGTFPLEKRTTSTTRMWFSGAFTYYLQRDSNVAARMARYAQEANRLYGILPTPDNIWKATPWTWALDWFSDAGAVMHNISALRPHSQVMRYGYIMCENRTEVTCTLGTRNVLGLDLSQTFGSYTKRRMRATPYGFGLDPAAFNAAQWAIIGALGISRAPNQLNNWP